MRCLTGRRKFSANPLDPRPIHTEIVVTGARHGADIDLGGRANDKIDVVDETEYPAGEGRT